MNEPHHIPPRAPQEEPSFSSSIRLDVMAVMDRDPACRSYLDALLYFKVCC